MPDRTTLVSLYKSHTLQQIADLYKTSKTRVRKWFDQQAIKKRPQGAGNHQLYATDAKTLQRLIDDRLTNAEIARKLGCRDTNICRAMKVHGLIPYRRPLQSEFRRYASRVHRVTELVYKANKHILNPLDLPRTLHGVPGGYQVDHIKGIRECFDAKWSMQETAALTNLQFIPWEDNLARRKFKCLKQTT